MQTLIPPSVTVKAQPVGRFGRIAGFGLTPRALMLLSAGVLLSIPAFFHTGRLWIMLAWDGLMLGLIVVNLLQLPAPDQCIRLRLVLRRKSSTRSCSRRGSCWRSA
jgi:hypothetical protein